MKAISKPYQSHTNNTYPYNIQSAYGPHIEHT